VSLRSPRWFTLLFLLGAGLRLGLYLANRSLWADEARVALNLLHKSPRQLLGSLELGQVAPPGFLLLGKAVASIVGYSELALRLVPLLVSLASLPLFISLARRRLRPAAALLAGLLFVTSEPLIYYATEVKQYAGDVTVELILWWLATRAEEGDFRRGRYASLGLAGGVALFFSHAAAFVLAGIALAALIDGKGDFAAARRRRVLGTAAAAIVWAAAFAGMYALSWHRYAKNAQLVGYFAERLEGFPPPGTLAALKWLLGRMAQVLVYPGSLNRVVAVLGVLFGLIVISRRDRRRLVMWTAPGALALLAAALRLYPFEGRLILFVIPALYLIVAEGMEEIRVRTRSSTPILFAAVWILLLIHPVVAMSQGMVRPRYFEQTRPVLQYVSAARRPGDVVYIYYGAQYAVRYYLETRTLSLADVAVESMLAPSTDAEVNWYQPALVSRPPSFLVGTGSRENWLDYGRQVETLAGHARVWIIFSHVFSGDGVDERDLILRFLDRLGTRQDAFGQPGASAFLYDTRSRPGG
jgi:4-amino-4-deoxy-L-arabinose transferase-like glycosyltransferase